MQILTRGKAKTWGKTSAGEITGCTKGLLRKKIRSTEKTWDRMLPTRRGGTNPISMRAWFSGA